MFKNNLKESKTTQAKLSNKDKIEDAKLNNTKVRENNKFLKRKLYIIYIISVILIVAIIAILATYLNSVKYRKYFKYEEKMHTYGFDIMYNNKSAKTSESVTTAEALKLAIGAVLNTTDISGFASENNEFENSIWTQYANDKKISDGTINSDNFNNKAKYIDVITYFENCKKMFLKNQTIKDTAVSLKDISKYTVQQQTAIKDMVASQIIYLISNKLNGNENIFKGQVNELVVNFVEKYNTIALVGDKLNIDPNKIPSNADQYPYTLASIDKSVYELPFFTSYVADKVSPKELYSSKKEIYPQIQERTESFFNVILNVDYKTITEENFKEKLSQYFIFPANEALIKYYIKYVKDNEIVIEGNSKLQLPIIYSDGDSYRARIRLQFEIKHSKTNENLLYLDSFNGLKSTYEKKRYDILIDYKLLTSIGNNNMYLTDDKLYDTILDKEKCGIIKEVYSGNDAIEEKVDENN